MEKFVVSEIGQHFDDIWLHLCDYPEFDELCLCIYEWYGTYNDVRDIIIWTWTSI